MKGAARAWVCLRLGAAVSGSARSEPARVGQAFGVCALDPAARALLRWVDGSMGACPVLRRAGRGLRGAHGAMGSLCTGATLGVSVALPLQARCASALGGQCGSFKVWRVPGCVCDTVSWFSDRHGADENFSARRTTMFLSWRRHMFALFCYYYLYALRYANASCVGVNNFPEHGLNQLSAASAGIFTKSAWFAHLQNGFNLEGRNSCLRYHDADTVLPKCMRDAGFRFALFIGDSLTRELAWSFAFHSGENSTNECRPGIKRLEAAREDERKKFYSKSSPGYKCSAVDSMDSLCPFERQLPLDTLPNNTESCCDSFWMLNIWNNIPDGSLENTIEHISNICKCRGLVYANYGIHLILQPWNNTPSTDVPPPWSYPFGRVEGLRLLLRKISNYPNIKFVWGSTAQVDETLVMLHPRKYDWRAFAQFSIAKQWELVDRNLTDEFGTYLAPQYEVSKRFGGLQGDGMHFAGSFPVVTDVLTQVLLNYLCLGTHISIC